MKDKTNKKKTLPILVFGMVACIMCLLLASCGKTEAKQYDCLVTFDYNVGTIEANYKNQYLGVKKGSLVGLKPGDRSDFEEATIRGYYLEAWYTAKTDEAGNVVKDATTGRVEPGEKWDFETMTVESDLTLYANLIRVAEMKYVDVDVYVENPEAEGAVLSVKSDRPGTRRAKPSSVLAPKKSGYTLLEYYKDAECTEVFEWPYIVTTEDVTVYVKFIEGDWAIVRTAKELISAIVGQKNIYLVNDIDFAGTDWARNDYNAEFNGNGHTVRNISYKRVCTKNVKDSGLFGTLKSGANIHDVIFENVKLEFKVALGDHKSGFIAYAAEQGAKLTNVTISGTLYYDYGTSVGSEYNTWIMEDKSTSTDCDYSKVTAVETKIKD